MFVGVHLSEKLSDYVFMDKVKVINPCIFGESPYKSNFSLQKCPIYYRSDTAKISWPTVARLDMQVKTIPKILHLYVGEIHFAHSHKKRAHHFFDKSIDFPFVFIADNVGVWRNWWMPWRRTYSG